MLFSARISLGGFESLFWRFRISLGDFEIISLGDFESLGDFSRRFLIRVSGTGCVGGRAGGRAGGSGPPASGTPLFQSRPAQGGARMRASLRCSPVAFRSSPPDRTWSSNSCRSYSVPGSRNDACDNVGEGVIGAAGTTCAARCPNRKSCQVP